MRPQDILLGSLISFVVSGLKRIRFVKRHPKVATAVLSTVIPAGIAVYGQVQGVEVAPIADIATQIATQFASAVATHETVTHPVKEKIGL